MTSRPDPDLISYTIVEKARDASGNFTVRRRNIGSYDTITEARVAQEELLDTRLNPSGYDEMQDYSWIRYGDPINDEYHYFIEPLTTS